MYGTTPLFMERLGIASLEDLPPITDFVPDANVVEALERTLRVVPDVATTPDGTAQLDAPED
jgi:segregation and condensation protein B